MTLRVVAFARIRELLGAQRSMTVAPGTRASGVWAALEAEHPELAELAASTRIARNGRIAGRDEELEDGDEIALLPPAGGG